MESFSSRRALQIAVTACHHPCRRLQIESHWTPPVLRDFQKLRRSAFRQLWNCDSLHPYQQPLLPDYTSELGSIARTM